MVNQLMAQLGFKFVDGQWLGVPGYAYLEYDASQIEDMGIIAIVKMLMDDAYSAGYDAAEEKMMIEAGIH